MRPVKIEIDKRDKVCVFQISGEVRLGQPTELLRQICKDQLEAGEKQFVFDMLDVPWLDSSGIGQVFGCFKRAREEHGCVKLVLRGKSYSLYTITQLDKVFEIFDDVDAAVASYS